MAQKPPQPSTQPSLIVTATGKPAIAPRSCPFMGLMIAQDPTTGQQAAGLSPCSGKLCMMYELDMCLIRNFLLTQADPDGCEDEEIVDGDMSKPQV